MPLILQRKPRPPRNVDPIERIHALNPRRPLIIRQERAYGNHRVYDLRLGQYVGPGFRDWCDAETYREQLENLDRLTGQAHTWTAADEAMVRRLCS